MSILTKLKQQLKSKTIQFAAAKFASGLIGLIMANPAVMPPPIAIGLMALGVLDATLRNVTTQAIDDK